MDPDGSLPMWEDRSSEMSCQTTGHFHATPQPGPGTAGLQADTRLIVSEGSFIAESLHVGRSDQNDS
jgi:hypothetical protein